MQPVGATVEGNRGHWKREWDTRWPASPTFELTDNFSLALRQPAGAHAQPETTNERIVMAKKPPFMPNKQAGKLAKAVQMHGVLAATGVDPTHYGLTATDVTELGTLLTGAQAAHAARENSKESKKASTNAFSGPGQALDQLTAKVQECGNKIRVSDCTDNEALATGTDRRKGSPSPQDLPANPPGVTLDSLQPNLLRVRVYDTGNAGARALATNVNGAQLAVVNGTGPVVANEANTVPTILVTRSPWTLDSSNMPGTVRIYARWLASRGRVGSWSAPLTVHVA